MSELRLTDADVYDVACQAGLTLTCYGSGKTKRFEFYNVKTGHTYKQEGTRNALMWALGYKEAKTEHGWQRT